MRATWTAQREGTPNHPYDDGPWSEWSGAGGEDRRSGTRERMNPTTRMKQAQGRKWWDGDFIGNAMIERGAAHRSSRPSRVSSIQACNPL